MHKIKSIVISILLLLLLSACSATTDTAVNTEIQPSSTATTTAAQQETTSENGSKPQSQQASEAEKDGKTSTKSKPTEKNSTVKTTSASTTNNTQKPAKKESTTEKRTEQQTKSSVTCSVAIECKSVLSNMDKLKDGHSSYVPADGVMLSSYRVTLDNGATAYDAVKQACSENSITINSKSSSYGVYIMGFNNIDEKDCGGASGWLFYVNGSMPNKSCGKYIVQDGDSITFSFTC